MNTSMSAMSFFNLAFVLSGTLMGGGCVAAPDDPTDDPTGDRPEGGAQVGETTQAFSSYGSIVRNLQVIIDSGLNLSSNTNSTCFLAGTFGRFAPNDGSSSGAFPAFSGVQLRGTQWVGLSEDVTAAERVGTHVVCLPSAANSVLPHTWHTGQPAVQLGAVQGNRVCALTSVQSDKAADFTSASDEVKVFSAAGFWWLGGSGNAAGSAACVDKSNNFGIVGVWNAGTVTTLNLAQSPDTGSNPLGVQCFLAGVKGAFTTNSYSNGIGVSFDASLLQWVLNVSTGKTGTAVCVQ